VVVRVRNGQYENWQGHLQKWVFPLLLFCKWRLESDENEGRVFLVFFLWPKKWIFTRTIYQEIFQIMYVHLTTIHQMTTRWWWEKKNYFKKIKSCERLPKEDGSLVTICKWQLDEHKNNVQQKIGENLCKKGPLFSPYSTYFSEQNQNMIFMPVLCKPGRVIKAQNFYRATKMACIPPTQPCSH
jgi:hypothetical protein